MLTVVSLFSGVEGFGLGLEDTGGFRVVAQVEQDPYCLAVLEQHWPDVPRFTDVRTAGGHNLPRADVITGGFPCQDISVAGEGAGIDGARSGLWAEYARIIRELRPRYVIVENVSALLARGLGRVLGDLAACGYDAEWDCIPASAIGACHQRDRVWLVAYPGGEGRWEDARGASGDEEADAGRGTQDDHKPGRAGEERPQAADAQDPDSLAVGARRERGRAPHAALRVVADSEGVGEELRAAEGERSRGSSSGGSGTAADAQGPRLEGAGVRGRPAVHGPAVAADSEDERHERAGEAWDWRLGPADGDSGDFDWQQYEPAIRRWEAIYGAPAPLPFLRGVDAGIPNRLDRLTALGNSLVPQIAEAIGRRIIDYERGGVSDAA